MVVINILKGMYVGIFVKYLLLRQILTKTGKCRQILLIISSISVLENVIGSMRTEERADKHDADSGCFAQLLR